MRNVFPGPYIAQRQSTWTPSTIPSPAAPRPSSFYPLRNTSWIVVLLLLAYRPLLTVTANTLSPLQKAAAGILDGAGAGSGVDRSQQQRPKVPPPSKKPVAVATSATVVKKPVKVMVPKVKTAPAAVRRGSAVSSHSSRDLFVRLGRALIPEKVRERGGGRG